MGERRSSTTRKAKDVPVDFVSTHVYANDTADNVLGTDENIPRDTMVWRAVKNGARGDRRLAYPQLPLIFSEYNASYANEPNVTDSTFMGPWLANNIRLCDGLTQSMDYWAFSDVFEEQGVVRTPFYGGFGLIAADHIPKPTLNIFALCTSSATGASPRLRLRAGHRDRAQAHSRSRSGTMRRPPAPAPAYTMPTRPRRPAKTFDLELKNVAPNAIAEVWRVDDDHGNVLKAFDAMGRPPGDLTQQQIASSAPRARWHRRSECT